MDNSFLTSVGRTAPLCLSLLLGLAAPLSRAAELTWLTDLPKAQARAKDEKKSVLLLFHGSDWCPNCLEMQHEVLESSQFVAYARQTLVLVDVDFPEKLPQTEALRKANLALQNRFNVGENYPTLVLLNDSGDTVFQEAGYTSGGGNLVLTNLQRHAPMPSASKSTGFKDLTVADFAKMTTDKQAVIIDVRTAVEFASGHLAGAINLDVTAPDFEKKDGALDKGKTYLVHCASGVRSVRACTKLAQLYFPKLYNLPGGYRAWVAAGQPVDR